jgi:hypothetical protein
VEFVGRERPFALSALSVEPPLTVCRAVVCQN